MKFNFLMSGIAASGGTKIILDYANHLAKKHDVCFYVCGRGVVHGPKIIFLPYVSIRYLKRAILSCKPLGTTITLLKDITPKQFVNKGCRHNNSNAMEYYLLSQ